MPDDLIDLMNEALRRQKGPVLAQSRDTHAPIYLGRTGDVPVPDDGVTFDGGADSNLSFDDKTRLLERGFHKKVGLLNMLNGMKGVPNDKGVMYINPKGSNPTNTIRHEVIHNILNQGGVKDKHYDAFMRTNPSLLDPLLHKYYDAKRSGPPSSELPAYLGAYDPKDLPDVNPQDRDSYVDLFSRYINTINPTAARKYQQISSRP